MRQIEKKRCSLKLNQRGVTLIEVMLVLLIGMSIFLLGLRQYFSYRRQADIQQLQYNVSTLFQGLGRYFRANCKSAPALNSFHAGGIAAVDFNKLVSEGYLSEKLMLNPYIQGGGTTAAGYILQFNQMQQSGALPMRQQTLAGGGNANLGYITVWQAQVAVNLTSLLPPSVMLGAAGAACLSDITEDPVSGLTAVKPCGSASAPNQKNTIPVWQRLPSYVSNNARDNSTFWPTIPIVKQFTQMYSTNPFAALAEPNLNFSVNQYYVCGS